MAYSVTDTKEMQTITPAGGRKKMFRVWLKTGRGSTGSVDVEPADWTAEKLLTILSAKATNLDLAFTLPG